MLKYFGKIKVNNNDIDEKYYAFNIYILIYNIIIILL